MISLQLSVLVAVAYLCAPSASVAEDSLLLSNVQRAVDLTSHLPKFTASFSLENTGSSVVPSFIFYAEQGLEDKLTYITAAVKTGETTTTLKVTPAGPAKYKISLASALAQGKKANIEVESAYAHSLRPFPAQIAQDEKQLMEFTCAQYLATPYKVSLQTTVITAASSTIESYTKPAKLSDSVITYGPYTDVPASSSATVSVHFERQAPFVAVSELHRLIEVSHWGNLAVEETVDLRHAGAALKGSFSRYDYQRAHGPSAAVKDFKTQLPAAAKDVYYRDEIGNISTSHLREQSDAVEVELRPRFPLFGGWKTHYTLGYNLPSYQYLYTKGDEFLLKMRLLDHIIDDQVVDAMTLKIILPEGAQNIRFNAPFPVEREESAPEYTYLDTVGRPVVVAKAKRLAEFHIQDFELRYTFQRVRLLQEPLLLVSAFFLLFLVIIIYVRLDFTITKDAGAESRMRVSALVEQTGATQDRRSALYQAYDDAIEKFKQTKDATAFAAARKKIDADYKAMCAQMAALLAKLKPESAETGEKVAELQRLDERMRAEIGACATLAERLVGGKMQKAAYVEQEKGVAEKRAELHQKMEALLTAL